MLKICVSYGSGSIEVRNAKCGIAQNMQNDRGLTRNDNKTLGCQTLQNDRGLTKLPMIIAGHL